jgi:ribosomal protein S10
MPFITRLTLRSGDRAALDGVVDDLRRAAERQGIELKGPHTAPPETYTVPQHRRLSPDAEDRFEPWEYTVYERTVEITGHDDSVRTIADWEFPPGVHVEITVDRTRSIGSR